MAKRICFIQTDTNGLHRSEEVSKKYLYNFSRMVRLNYDIGTIKKGVYKSEIKKNKIIKPHCFIITKETSDIHNITQSIAEEKGEDCYAVLQELKADLKKVDIIVTFYAKFHLNTILAEGCRYNVMIDMTKFCIIDLKTFNHNYDSIKLKTLYKHIINNDNDDNISMMIGIFLNKYNVHISLDK